MIELLELVEISKYAGERFDLIQAGGGNSSVKLDNGEMIIKASGYALSEVSEIAGYSRVYTREIADIVNDKAIINETSKRIREQKTSEIVKTHTIDVNNRPSIETLLHSFLSKYTLHTHPIVVNAIVSQKNWKGILNKIFPKNELVLINYETPGIELALSLRNELEKTDNIPSIIFLGNHGLIITTDNKEELFRLNEFVLAKIETYLKIDLVKYKLTTQISNILNNLNKEQCITYLCDDGFLNNALKDNKHLFFLDPFSADTFVFAGAGAVEINDLNSIEEVKLYIQKYHVLPTVYIINNHIYIYAKSVKKAKEISDVLKFHIMILSVNSDNINYLKNEELLYLSNWEAEKFRQNL
jgi:ribulose-5-phosphate 4-epimerase/fuculose-1-phosphate aldolase